MYIYLCVQRVKKVKISVDKSNTKQHATPYSFLVCKILVKYILESYKENDNILNILSFSK